MKILTKNKAKCKKCGDIIESVHRHDFKWCSCESIAVDGGTAYIKRCGNLEDIEDMCEYREPSRAEKEQFIKNNIEDYFMLLNDTDIDLIVEKLEEMN